MPAEFLELLREAHQVFTPIDTDSPEHQWAINIAFVTELVSDSRKKLQELEGFEGMNRSQLLETAQRVYNICDTVEDKQNKKLTGSGGSSGRERW